MSETRRASRGMRTISAVEFAAIPGFRPLELDLYTPTAGADHPVIVFIHGGAWLMASRRSVAPEMDLWETGFFERLVDAGFAVASVDYRLSAEARFPAQLHDVKAAVRWLRAHATEYGLDPTAIVAWGASAGGHLAALLGLTGGRDDLEGAVGERGEDSSVAAVVDWYGPSDLLALAAQPAMGPMEHDSVRSPEGQLLGGQVSAVPDLARAASPTTYAGEHAVPFFIAHGDEDKLVPHSQGELLRAALESHGATVEFLSVDGADHNWGGKEQADIVAIIDRSVEFVRRVIASPPSTG